MSLPPFTPYDNALTYSYKLSALYSLPRRLIVQQQPILNIFTTFIQENISPSEIYEEITKQSSSITLDDLIFTYYQYLRTPNSIKEVNDFVRAIDETITADKFTSLKNFQIDYQAWTSKNEAIWQDEQATLEEIKLVQSSLAFLENQRQNSPELLQVSPISIHKTTYSYEPSYYDKFVTPALGLDIFQDTQVNIYVPYIVYVDEFGQQYSRIYSGFETTPNYRNTIITVSSTDRNMFYFTLWSGNEDTDNLATSVKDNFETISYNLERNYINIKAQKDLDASFNRIQMAFPTLNFGPGVEIKVSGEFDLWNFTYDETYFLHSILNELTLTVFLYLDESKTKYSDKKRLDIQYRSMFIDENEGTLPRNDTYIASTSEVSIVMTPVTSTEPKTITFADRTLEMPANTSYTHVLISQAISQDALTHFMRIFPLLLMYYQQTVNNAVPYYLQLPELQNITEFITSKQRSKLTLPTSRVGTKTVNILHEKAREIFVNGYARRCLANFQPQILTTQEYEIWRHENLGTPLANRQVMPFPKDNPRYYFICPQDEAPYPGVITNRTLSNAQTYPYLPCCFKADQMTPGVNSNYQNYLADILPSQKVAKSTYGIITNKILSFQNFGTLPTIYRSLLKDYTTEILRYGTVPGPNSAIHAILIALQDSEYSSAESDTEREDYVQALREEITCQPELLAQEMFDYEPNDRIARLQNSTIFLDTAIYYRALEEHFNINIYVFATHDSSDGKLRELQIPRHRIYHCRPQRLYRPTVILYANPGSESDNLVHDHYELIVDVNSKENTIALQFGSQMTERLHSILQQTARTLTWTLEPNNSQFVARENINYYIDYLSLLNLPPVSQYIDNFGKMRALTVKISSQESLTIMMPPSQPENLPHSLDFSRLPYNLITRIFSRTTISAITKNAQKITDGLWLPILDLTYGLYIPIIETSEDLNLPIGPDAPIIITLNNNRLTTRLQKLKWQLNIIVQVIQWLFEIAKITDPNISVDNFTLQYFTYSEEIVADSSEFYDFTNLPRTFPRDMVSVQEAISQLSIYQTNLLVLVDGQASILMYSLEFYSHIRGMLQTYRRYRYGLDAEPAPFISNYYMTEDNFRQTKGSPVLASTTSLQNWLSSESNMINYNNTFGVYTQILTSYRNNIDPYLYVDNYNRMFLVQNIISGNRQDTMKRASVIGRNWIEYRVNIGSNPVFDPDDAIPEHTMYVILSNNTIGPVTPEIPQVIRILLYGYINDYNNQLINHRYAVLLQLL